MLLLGKPVAERIFSETKERIKTSGIVPGIVAVLVGDDPASRIYVGIKEMRAQEIGMRFELRTFEKTASEREILDSVSALNGRDDVHGIIVQLPLPIGLDADRIIGSIDPAKDADGFLTADRIPVFPEAMIELAKSSGITFDGKTSIVLANSERFGRVMTDALAREGMNAEYILARDFDANRSMLMTAEAVFTALGRPEILPRYLFKKGAVVIDGGISEKDGKVVGDVSDEGGDADILLSPVPGGVGPVTVACLLRRTTDLALEKKKTA